MEPKIGLDIVEGPELVLTMECPKCGHVARRSFRGCRAGDVVTCTCGAVSYTFTNSDLDAAQRQIDELKRKIADLGRSLGRKR